MVQPALTSRLQEAAGAACGAPPYAAALPGGGLPLESYVGHLRGLAALHAVLERELGRSREDRVRGVWSEALRRLPRVQADLGHFGAQGVRDIPAAHDATAALVDAVLRRAVDRPLSLLGYLWALEASIPGADALAPGLARTFGLDQHRGLAYLTWSPAEAAERRQDLGRRLDALALAPEEAEALAAAAAEAALGLQRLYAALHPFDPAALTRLVGSINPEAGAHPVPEDPAELEASRRAATRAWEAFPYLAARFGERGWRFTQSDSAWLVTLAALEPPVLEAQVVWLGGVLASRGIPTLVLQRHLDLLHEELTAGAPAPAPGYDGLRAAAQALVRRRRAVLSDGDLEAVRRRFAQEAGPAEVAGAADLLAWAVADRAQGTARAVASLEPWLADPGRFPAAWTAAVRGAVAEAEARLRA